MSLLNVQNIAKRYGSVIALRSADLVVEPGEIHALLGANGAGKSTLVKILTGVIGADSGTITLAGKPLAHRLARRGARRPASRPCSRTRRWCPTSPSRQNMRLTGTEHGRRPGVAARRWISRSTPTSWSATCRWPCCA